MRQVRSGWFLAFLTVSAVSAQTSIVSQIGGECQALFYVPPKLLYAAYGPNLVIYQVSNFSNPVHLGSYQAPGFIHGLQVVGGIAYLAAGPAGLRLVNVSNTTFPVPLGSWSVPTSGLPFGTALGVAVSNNFAYLVIGKSGIIVLNVASPNSITIHTNATVLACTTSFTDPCANAIALSPATGTPAAPTIAYVADGTNGVRILNISGSLQGLGPREIANYTTTEQVVGVFATSDFLYVAAQSAGILVLDITKPTVPTLIGTFAQASTSCYGISISSDSSLAYAACGDAGALVLDNSNPAGLTIATSETFTTNTIPGFAYSIVDDQQSPPETVMIANGWGGVRIVDISNQPEPPVLDAITRNNPGDAVMNVALSEDGTLVYVADWDVGLCIVNISSMFSPSLLSCFSAPGYTADVKVNGSYAFLAVQTNSANGGTAPNSILAVDVSNPSQPTLVGNLTISGTSSAIVILDSIAYVATENAGVRIVNISNVRNLTEIASYVTIAPVTYVAVTTGMYNGSMHTFLAMSVGTVETGTGQVQITDATDPDKSPSLLSSISATAGEFYGMRLLWPLLYVANGGAGVKIYNLSTPASPEAVSTYKPAGTVNDVEVSQGVNGTVFFHVAGSEYGITLANATTITAVTKIAQTYGIGTATSVIAGGTPEQPFTITASAEGGLVIYSLLSPVYPPVPPGYALPPPLSSPITVPVSGKAVGSSNHLLAVSATTIFVLLSFV